MSKKDIIHLELLIAATIITFVFIQAIHPENINLITTTLSLISAIILIIHTLKQQRSLWISSFAIICGFLLICAGGITAMGLEILGSTSSESINSVILISSGLILITLAVLSRTNPKDYGIRDERTLRIGTYGLSYSWYLTYLTIVIIGWMMGTRAIITVDGTQVCLLLIILMPVSALLFQWYFNTKGDVY